MADLHGFIARLREAKYFEDAAHLLLGELCAAAKGALGASPFAKYGRVLRGMVHLRPGDGYQRLVVFDESRASAGRPESLHLPSASAWRHVARRLAPIAVDVSVGRVRAWSSGKTEVLAEGGLSESESMHRLTSRDASHLFATPVRSLRGAVEGMATVEIGCPRAAGDDFILSGFAPALEILADVASPYLVGLPLRPAAAFPTDELLPVVGAAMAPLVEMLRVFAAQEETLLIGGPTGAGKSRLARWCHARSPRRAEPFEVLDLITVPEDLQMAELCGWKRGAFTGAVRDAPGAIARATRGTLFIDEIDKLSLKAQAGLLHLLESRKYRTLGDSGREQIADVRFIVGSNANLARAARGPWSGEGGSMDFEGTPRRLVRIGCSLRRATRLDLRPTSA